MRREWAMVVALAWGLGCGKEGGASSSSTSPSPSTTTSTTTTTTTTPTSTAAPSPPPDAIIAQHILVIYKGAKRAPKAITRSKAEAKARAQEALGKVRGGAAFEDVVKQYSDDAGSADRMGSLGKFHRDDMDPAFSAAAFGLKAGEVSDVVETPFGFHVIKRTQ